MSTWTNKNYPLCKDHVADHNWPTLEGGVCFKLSSPDEKCNHYFDSWQQAYGMGWRKQLPKGEINRQKSGRK